MNALIHLAKGSTVNIKQSSGQGCAMGAYHTTQRKKRRKVCPEDKEGAIFEAYH